ncbi:unnamed protein product [Ectocarpus sp. 6 AP-2014]|uniref:Soluble NSF Attachment Protein (SNAP) Receptor (SNARE) n=1 Tax=Ectocarpus siliculosus TaxID=2880 RepID=D7FKW1_ECTSI|nr:Soluble NSF Attachment Protein (SNAP) Receptor (SNARE) [Ectocarpus siliculosus]|eukprot:CBJ29506.1 Soluble NSF Attachment Protein (SNAP) Receptor (SNARE) [Ectocarpus siliculosus]
MSLNSVASHDPFYAVRDEVSAKIEYIKVRLERFQDLLNNTNTAQNRDFQDLRKGLTKEVKGADAQLRDLRRTVEYVENNRDSFAHIDNAELSERKTFLSDSKQVLLRASDALDGQQTKEKMAQDDRSEMAKYRSKGDLGARTEVERDNTEHILDHQSRVRMQLARQDEDLEELGTHVERVGETATVINEELRSQNRLLTALDDDMDEATESMNFVMGRLGKLLKTKSKCQIWTILLLSFILIILVLMLIYV